MFMGVDECVDIAPIDPAKVNNGFHSQLFLRIQGLWIEAA